MTLFNPRPVYAPDPPGGGTPPAPPPNGAPSLLGTPPAPEGGPPPDPNAAPTSLPDTWREIMAGGDADVLTELKRYPTYSDAAKNILNLKKAARTSSIEAEPMPDAGDGKDPTKVEALKTWREKHGIPAEPTGYVIPEPVAKRLTEMDKPLVESFTAAAHKEGMSPKVVEFGTKWYVDAMEAEAQREADGDKKDSEATEDHLRGAWGTDYKRNLDFASRTALELLGKDTDFGGSIFDARLPNGMKLGSIPGFVEGMHKVGLAMFGDGSLVGDEAVKATGARKAEIEQIMATDINRYRTEGLDKEYRKILDAEESAGKLGGR